MRLFRTLTTIGAVWIVLRLVNAPILAVVPGELVPYIDGLSAVFIVFNITGVFYLLFEVVGFMYGVVDGVYFLVKGMRKSPEVKILEAIYEQKLEELEKVRENKEQKRKVEVVGRG